jgi:3-mercaptopyruvate sulfurtransferase SseA
MRFALAAAVVTALAAATAGAQYKPQPTAPPTTPSQPGAVQIAPNPSVQISKPSAADDELAKARRIPRDQAINMVKQGKAVYVDVRSKETFDEGHLPGAISIPLSQFQTRYRELPLNKFLITYCA